MMPKGYAIYLAKDNKTLKVVEFPIRLYAKSQQLLLFMCEHKGGTVTTADLKAAGFEDITGELLYPTYRMGKSGKVKMADEAQIVIDDKGIQELLGRIVAYNNCQAAERIDMNRLARIDYSEQSYKYSVESIEKCIHHFYQLIDSLQAAFADIPGLSFEIGEEEVQYANLHFRILYKGRYFLHLLGKFGNANFIHIVDSKFRFPQWEVVVHPFKATCQLHNFFKDIHIQSISDNEVLRRVTEPYNGRFNQYAEVRKQFAEIFDTDLNDSELEYDLVRDCVMLNSESEGRILRMLLPQPVISDRKEFYKYTTLETFMKIFQNWTIRMNSVVAMNDTSETNILQNAIRNFKEPIESEADTYLESNTRFITSFSALEDSLPMWSQYGNKGTGVCLVFERGPQFKDDYLLHITYISKNDETVKKIEKIQSALKFKGINFYLALLDKYRNFIKYDFYKSEDEYRYLVVQEKEEQWTVNADYNLIAPYIEKTLPIGNTAKRSNQKKSFPFVLRRVILGPAMPNQQYNVWQLNYMASRKGLRNFKAEASKIDNFR